MDRLSYLLLLTITVSIISGTFGAPGKRPVCGCMCPNINKLTVCDTVAGLVGSVHANVEQLRIWAKHRHFVEHFSENWREEIADIVKTEIKDYISRGELHIKPEIEAEDLMMKDSTLVPRLVEEDNLAKNVSTLLEKVESVENRTMAVENELRTERRVRRDLEAKVDKTHSSLVFIEDHLLNVSSPMDAMVTEVEMKLYSSIEDLNKTIYEDHLKKLYYKVDGVVYKNETKKLDERLDSIEGELHGSSNESIVSKFSEDLKNLEQNLYHLNNSIGEVVVPSLQMLNNSIEDVLIPRLETLEVETVRKDAAEELEEKMNSLINDTELVKVALVDVLSSAQDVQNLEKKFQNFSEHLTKSLEIMQKRIDDLKNETIVIKNDIDEDVDVIGISRIVQQTTEDFTESEGANNGGREIETLFTTESETTGLESNYITTEYEIDDVPEYRATLQEQTSTVVDDITDYETTLAEQTSSDVNKITDHETTETTLEEQTSSDTNDIPDYDTTETNLEEQTSSEVNKITDHGTTERTVEEQTSSDFNNIPDYEPTLEEQTSSDVNDITTFEEQTSPEPNSIFVEDRGRIDNKDCDVPSVDDPHLLVDIERKEDGRQTLKFGCTPIGRYVVPRVPVPPRCEKGSWRTPIPSCIELPSENTINSLAEQLLKEHPCSKGEGEFPDPTNCTRFFKCSHGTARTFPCPSGLLFNANLKVCDFPRAVQCFSRKTKLVEELEALVPPIRIDPDRLDKKSSLLATGRAGELIVHPRAGFTLHCLYPYSVYGYPSWNVTYSKTGTNPRALAVKKGDNRISLTVTSAKEEDSGAYRCSTPFGQHHDVEVRVKAVVCPALPEEEEYEDVYYRPTPEGELRILGTTAEVQCEEGHTVVARCTAQGEWATDFADDRQCTPKKRQEKIWNCNPLDLSKRPDLITEKFNDEKMLAFKCAGRKRLSGNTFTRCLEDGSWSHASLPYCRN